MGAKKRRKYVPRFIMLEHGLMDSPAFKSLRGDSIKLLMAVWKRHDGKNNGEISFSVRDAAQLIPCTPNTAGKRFDELQEKGFLAVEVKGAFRAAAKHKAASTWRLTLESCRGKPPTREYQRWRPSESVSGDIKTGSKK
ncbi:MAG: hypothetical protein ACREHV_00640 [Rhizomicrobium sp.]